MATELFNLTLVIEAEVTSQYVDESGNVVIEREDGSTEVVNSQGEVISTTPPTNSTGGGTGSTGNDDGSTGTGEVRFQSLQRRFGYHTKRWHL